MVLFYTVLCTLRCHALGIVACEHVISLYGVIIVLNVSFFRIWTCKFDAGGDRV